MIGWLTHQTVTGVYEKVLADGLSTASNPLYYARNAVIYVLLIGSRIAIVLGVHARLRDRKAATTDLVLGRPVASVARLGLLAGLGVVLAELQGLAIALPAAAAPVGTSVSGRRAHRRHRHRQRAGRGRGRR